MQTSARLSQKLKAISSDAAGAPYAVGVAGTPAERLAAARLVGAMYRGEGYLAGVPERETGSEAFYTLHLLLDEAVIFVAREEESGRIVGTLTTVLDSAAGLPMDALYAEELALLRGQGRTCCEFCSLAVDPDCGSRATGLLLALFRVAYRYAHHQDRVDDVCVTLKPSHAGFYKRLGFEQCGPLRLDPRFGNADTIAMRLSSDVTRNLWASGEIHAPRHWMKVFCSEPLGAAEAQALCHARRASRRTAEDVLQAIERRPRLLDEAGPAACAYLEMSIGCAHCV